VGTTTVLISPDGGVGKLSFAALPGGRPDSYLVDEYLIAVVPVPQLIAEPKPAGEIRPEPSLMVIGDVDYAAATAAATQEPPPAKPTRSARFTRRGASFTFVDLPQTFVEINSVEGRFKRSFRDAQPPLQLDRGAATEAAFRLEAPHHRYLHVATHGFFAAAALPSALAQSTARDVGPATDAETDLWPAGIHPGLLSGLALTGANGAPAADTDDGILTALEVAMLDLQQVDLAVLSACETGLGKVAGGEGALGLQRSFQVAGARSVVASLWTIDDKATVELMDRFYENLWEKRLSKGESLRQAQIWMMREGRPRGLEFSASTPRSAARLPPYYWGAFVVSGDWK
jgi:CHAT domain-containing protein